MSPAKGVDSISHGILVESEKSIADEVIELFSDRFVFAFSLANLG